MNRQPVTSSNIASIGYDPTSQTLEIEFVSSGQVYQYFDVPDAVVQALMQASSIGAYFTQHIRNSYQYARL